MVTTAIILPRDSYEAALMDGDEGEARRLPTRVECGDCGSITDIGGSWPGEGWAGHTHDECDVCGERVTAGTLRERTPGSLECVSCPSTCACCGERVGEHALTVSPVTEQHVCGGCRAEEDEAARERGVTVAELAADWMRA